MMQWGMDARRYAICHLKQCRAWTPMMAQCHLKMQLWARDDGDMPPEAMQGMDADMMAQCHLKMQHGPEMMAICHRSNAGYGCDMMAHMPPEAMQGWTLWALMMIKYATGSNAGYGCRYDGAMPPEMRHGPEMMAICHLKQCRAWMPI